MASPGAKLQTTNVYGHRAALNPAALFRKDSTMRLPILAALATAASLLMSACGSAPAAGQTDHAPVAARCNAAPAQFAVGRNADAALENETRTRAGAKSMRVLKPNQIVTMEFNAERLNLSVDDAGRVARVNCG
jgi:hypothetical protein